MAEIRATAFARLIGCTPRAIGVQLTKKGMPGRKRKNVWYVDPDAAERWCRDNAPQLIKIEPAARAIRADAEAPAPPDDDQDNTPADEGEALNRAIGRLGQILDGLIATLYDGTFDARVVTSIKSISTELRQLELHRLSMREADARLMDRHEHLQIIDTIGRTVAQEAEGLKHLLPDEVIAKLVEAKIDLPEPKRAMRAIGAAAEAAAFRLRDSIATRIRDTITEQAAPTADEGQPR